MAADESKLGALHDKVAEVLIDALDGKQLPDYEDPETGEVVRGGKLNPSAAEITAAIQFLKNNNITCAPSESNALGELQRRMQERQEKRANKGKSPTATDLANAKEGMDWLDNRMGHA